MGEYVVLFCRWTDPLNRLFAHSRCRRRGVMLHLQDLPVNSTLASLWTTASTALSPPHSWLSHPASLLPSLLLHCVSCSTSLHPALYPARSHRHLSPMVDRWIQGAQMKFRLISSFFQNRYRPALAYKDDKSYLRIIPVDLSLHQLCHIYDAAMSVFI